MLEVRGKAMFWKGLTCDSRILVAVAMESVMVITSWILSLSIAGMKPMCMVMSLASIEVTFIVWIWSYLTT